MLPKDNILKSIKEVTELYGKSPAIEPEPDNVQTGLKPVSTEPEPDNVQTGLKPVSTEPEPENDIEPLPADEVLAIMEPQPEPDNVQTGLKPVSTEQEHVEFSKEYVINTSEYFTVSNVVQNVLREIIQVHEKLQYVDDGTKELSDHAKYSNARNELKNEADVQQFLPLYNSNLTFRQKWNDRSDALILLGNLLINFENMALVIQCYAAIKAFDDYMTYLQTGKQGPLIMPGQK